MLYVSAVNDAYVSVTDTKDGRVYYAVSQPCGEIVEMLKGVEDVICQCCVL